MGCDWKSLVATVLEWQVRNFPAVMSNKDWPLCGIAEEAGELMHALLKAEQGIRGTPEEWEAKKRDAVADIAIFAMSACGVRGWDGQETLGGSMSTGMLPLPSTERGVCMSIFALAGAVLEALVDSSLTTIDDDEMKMYNERELETRVHCVIQCCKVLCRMKAWDFDQLVNDTWNNIVSKRDWKTDPVNGGQPAPG